MQLQRLINRLSSAHTYFYIHIDHNVDSEPFKKLLFPRGNIIFLKEEERQTGIWGDIGIVKATLNALKHINNKKEGYTILMSGQDYPLATSSSILNFLNHNYGKHFISIFSLDENKWKVWAHNRITCYKINKSSHRGHFILLPSIWNKDFYQKKTFGSLNYLLKIRKYNLIFKIFKKRKFPAHLKAYGGSVYWGIPNYTVVKILDYIQANPQYLRYHEFTLCADEIFFHSIIKKIQETEYLEIAPSLTYVNWERKNVSLPVTFCSKDVDELKNAKKENFLFARKFDEAHDAKILDLLD